ncbi:hypothetical protein CcrC1_gp095 [Caulobacter phage C1]|nr:hypothetical protein CcrC1_gp095 [Caulobacter phage C1]UTU08323.1 hypothetical protein CcrC2_gp095 [Caulobacter phage C2]UTU08844.1 hypothetical protein CcrJ4_gp093 [Caulobacter phage J4]UTU09397.1 hypothetical protein CcrBL47_gp111 [Caulobacter phage BL47]UTU09957.1 hypothetical protein CcrRB23_gp095 [Caulobacter phage RB23]WGN96982.1 hypothetical protein [Bertelyvirus sp.]
MPEQAIICLDDEALDQEIAAAAQVETCPFCCSTRIEAPMEGHPSGYGAMMQTGPTVCFDCEAYEMSHWRDYPEATPEEKQKGWIRGTV